MNPQINPQISPTFHQGISPENVALLLKQFDHLQQELSRIKVDKKVKQQAAKKIQQARQAVNSQPDQNKIKASLKDAADMVQTAGKTAGNIQTFVKKASDMVSFLGALVTFG